MTWLDQIKRNAADGRWSDEAIGTQFRAWCRSPQSAMPDPRPAELDDETVEAIAKALYAEGAWCGNCAFCGWASCADCRKVCRTYANVAAKHLSALRPTEAEVREALAIDYWHDSSFRRVLRDLGCFRPEPEPR
jgi:hypothetical protein